MARFSLHVLTRLATVALWVGLAGVATQGSPARAGADAEVAYDIPQNGPRATLVVPDSWNPNANEDGVDGAAPDRRTFFDVAILRGTSEARELSRILAYFKDTGSAVNEASRSEAPSMIAGVGARRAAYTMRTAGRSQMLTIDVATLRSGDLVIVQQWGDIAPTSKNGRQLSAILATLKLK